MNKRVALMMVAVTTLGVISFTGIAGAQASDPTRLQSPVQFPDLASFIAGFMKAIVMISLPILTVAIVYSGFLFVAARGSSEGLAKAKTNFFYVIIGTILILGAWTLATLIGGTVTQLTG